MVADGGGGGGEAWTSDGQTNVINFIQFVCPSPWLLDGRYLADAGGVGGEEVDFYFNFLPA